MSAAPVVWIADRTYRLGSAYATRDRRQTVLVLHGFVPAARCDPADRHLAEAGGMVFYESAAVPSGAPRLSRMSAAAWVAAAGAETAAVRERLTDRQETDRA